MRCPALLLVVVLAVLPPGLGFAQVPKVELSLAAEETFVGQPLILRLTVLVPSFMPDPPALPSFEVPDLMVRLNGRATNPTSERVDGETWSGVTRSYSLYPMIPGAFVLPPQSVRVTYAVDGATPETVTIETEAVRFQARLPEGAEALDPPLIARGLNATQELEIPQGGVAVGDAITREVIVTIDGTSPLFVPPLFESAETEGLRAYPQDPGLTEKVDRGVLSGTRREAITYVALSEGEASLPAITLSWYNLTSKQVETLTLDGARFEVSPGPPAPFEPDLSAITRWILLLLIFAGGGLWVARKQGPKFRVWRAAQRAAREISEPRLYAAIRRAAAAQDFAQLWTALATYTAHHGDTRRTTAFDAALGAVAETAYGPHPVHSTDVEARWRTLGSVLSEIRPPKSAPGRTQVLPDLNPF